MLLSAGLYWILLKII